MATDLNARLRLATKIHLSLMRAVGQGVDMPAMLGQQAYAQSILDVCRKLGQPELSKVCDEFEAESYKARVWALPGVPASPPAHPPGTMLPASAAWDPNLPPPELSPGATHASRNSSFGPSSAPRSSSGSATGRSGFAQAMPPSALPGQSRFPQSQPASSPPAPISKSGQDADEERRKKYLRGAR